MTLKFKRQWAGLYFGRDDHYEYRIYQERPGVWLMDVKELITRTLQVDAVLTALTWAGGGGHDSYQGSGDFWWAGQGLAAYVESDLDGGWDYWVEDDRAGTTLMKNSAPVVSSDEAKARAEAEIERVLNLRNPSRHTTTGVRHALNQPVIDSSRGDSKKEMVAVANAYSDLGKDFRPEPGQPSKMTQAITIGYRALTVAEGWA